ncbi:MAG: phosphoenolpyruvate--protein phosphotransferase [Lachnospiraceae bacterium]|nr:phosphoenolpyruvate--protein phosphotransferase [Lachnospiraceae bacterium]MEE1014722.1 phosphoenolpyruvate--protein phosphotransferase [Lachnospiraceae bacterium]
MITCQGKSVFSGVAIGKIFVYKKAENTVEKYQIEDPAAEFERFKAAQAKAITQLQALYEKTCKDIGEEEAMIFEMHQQLLEDLDYVESIQGIIENDKLNAEYAVFVTAEQFAAMFIAMNDEYMSGRAVDVKDVSERVISILNGSQVSAEAMPEPVIILAEDLAPSETVQFEKDKLLAFVTQKGSANSHTAILARMMNLPSLVTTDIELNMEYHDKMAIVDGFTGKIYIEPDEVTMAEMKEKQKRAEERRRMLQTLKGLPTVTKSGKHVHLYANIGGVEDVDAVLENDCEGIGLFRSEFLYLGREDYPSEEEQFEAYKTVISRMAGKKVIIRTLDIGADKQADYFNIAKEENPALGFRAIRICLERVDMFKTQLRAIYRASAYGKASIMFPMIISVSEIIRIKEIVEEVKEELRQNDIPFGDVELGIMVETPAAVMISDQLAAEVEFFSIGTNDLTQYTLAIDRQNQALEPFYDAHHDAVLRMIQKTIENAHAHGAWCGICGELGADMELTRRFVQMGIDELSVSPPFTLELRKKIREID